MYTPIPDTWLLRPSSTEASSAPVATSLRALPSSALRSIALPSSAGLPLGSGWADCQKEAKPAAACHHLSVRV